MAHELAGTLQQAGRIREHCAVKEANVYVRSEYIDVAEGRISQTGNRTAVMQKLPDFVAAFSHHRKPPMRDGSQSTCMLNHPRIDGGIPLESAVESKDLGSHHRSHRHGVLRGTRRFQGATVSSYSMGSPKPSVWTPSWRRTSKAINRRCALNVTIWAKTPPNVKVSAGSHRASTNVSSHAERFRTSLKIRCSSASVLSSLCSISCGVRCDLGGLLISISAPDSAAVQTSLVKIMLLRVALESYSTPARAAVLRPWAAADPIVPLSKYLRIPANAACARSRCLQNDRINPCRFLLLKMNSLLMALGQKSEFCWTPASESADHACAGRGWEKSEKLFGKRE